MNIDFDKLKKILNEYENHKECFNYSSESKKYRILEYYVTELKNKIDDVSEIIENAYKDAIESTNVDETYDKLEKEIKEEKDFLNIFGPYVMLHSLNSQ